MIAEILSIGTELLLGDIVDTNSAYIAEHLTSAGFDIHYISTVGDNEDRLYQALNRAAERADIIITTGGLGPTDDDLTRELVAEVTGCQLVEIPELIAEINNYFHHRGYKMTGNNLKQGLLPEGAHPIPNEMGTAPGILLETDKYTIISLPGVPREMKYMFTEEVLPYLTSLGQNIIKSKVLRFFSIGESTLETRIKDIMDRQSNPTLALLAGTGEVKIRITAKGNSEEEVRGLINKTELEIRERVGRYIYGINEEDLPRIVGSLLLENGQTLSVAESCTGGMIGDRITGVPGSSNYFIGGMITYTNESKNKLLGVKVETLQKYGAVSEETVREMAVGVRDRMGSKLGLAVTGIAGPGGGSKEKPVGLVFIGLADEFEVKVFKLQLKGDRFWNKWMSSQYALYYLYRYLETLDS